jgi:hypothetical protein
MGALGRKQVPEVLDVFRAWVVNSVDRRSKGCQGDDVQCDMMEPFSNVDDPVPSLMKLFLNGRKKLGALGPEDWGQLLDVFELECRLEEFPIDLFADYEDAYRDMRTGMPYSVLLRRCHKDTTRAKLSHDFQRPRQLDVIVCLRLQNIFASLRCCDEYTLGIEEAIVANQAIIRYVVDPLDEPIVAWFLQETPPKRRLFWTR